MKKLIFLLVLGLSITACKTVAVTDFSKVKQLFQNTTWLLQDENGTVLSFNGEPVTMEFSEEQGFQAYGFSGCNRYFSGVTLLPESIKFDQPGSTMMACPEMKTEEMFLDLLSQVNAYEISNGELKLFQGKIVLLRFKSK